MNKYSVYIFLSLLIIQLLITFYSQTYLLTDDLYRLILGSQMTDRQFEDYLEFVRKWQWVSYLFIPLALLLRITFTWICLKAGSFITDRFTETSFWKIAIKGSIHKTRLIKIKS